ncbi:MAG: 50S ribosomal protein L11 methyltransferase [Proteobacteria bacterium]|nr:50S ribosomal protein L11 methyltransferase [Pseudomonadota bacterium]
MSANKWLKITIEADPLLVEPISDFLVGVIEAGVETGAPDEPNFGILTCYLQKANPDPEEVAEIVTRITSYLIELADIYNVPAPELVASLFDEEDWSSTWKEHFKPFAIVPGLVIAPTWEEYRPIPGEAVITMDPGMAFGTGHHATTSLSMELLRRTLTAGSVMRVLDVGTGTGILGMAAMLFGAASVLGIDNDPEAVAAADGNVRRNIFDDRMQVSLTPLGELSDQFQIVVANIVHDVLLDLAEDLTRLTAEDGVLILSGILVGEQVTRIKGFFGGKGFRVLDQEEREEWAALRFRKGEL